jgi:phosphatidylserine/phosphatidylglycerophosphate/cardiolipin synthase-like enzyme
MIRANQAAMFLGSSFRRSGAAGILAMALLAGGCAEEPVPPAAPQAVPVPAAGAIQESAGGIEVYFSPHGGCTNAVVRELDAARDSVLVQAYTFTSSPIAKALVAARGRGVNVQVILDKSQRTGGYSPATFFKDAGIPTFIDDKYAIAHNKVMVIDGRVVLTGSFNFDESAEEDNAENLLVLHDAATAAKYAANWNAHLAQSVPYHRERPLEKQGGEPSAFPRRGQSEGVNAR